MWVKIQTFLASPIYFVLGLPEKILKLSIPARASVFVIIFLLICLISAIIVDRTSTDVSILEDRGTFGFWMMVIFLMIAIPIVIYYLLKLWLEGDESRFPDIDFAWEAGNYELAKAGISLQDAPIFLVLGTAYDAEESAMFSTTGMSLNVKQIPDGPAALHWYANNDGVYIVCSQTSCLSRLRSLDLKMASSPIAASAPSGGGGGGVRGTMVAGGAAPAAAAPSPTATLIPGSPPPTSEAPPPSAAAPMPMGGIKGTMVAGAGGPIGDMDMGGVAERQVAGLTKEDLIEQSERLEYLCKLIRRARAPLCPVNGILTFAPFGLVQTGPGGAREVQRAAKEDVDTSLRTLQTKCAVNVVVVGMEKESGFTEMVRRVGRTRTAAQRFGKGFGLYGNPTTDQMEALSAHSCGAFEDWVYGLFREKDALTKPGNRSLYALLCKTRGDFRVRLGNMLSAVFSSNSREGDPLFFGGCYFAGTGQTEDRQAFIKGVFDKLPEQQDEVEWTDDALIADARCRKFAYIMILLNVLLIAGVAGMIAYRKFGI